MPIEELRLHGMSGTPPRELLYTDPVTYDRSDSHVKVWTKHDDARDFDINVKAFHWGSLTSGNKITAFWILLTPFVFANVSGWMQEDNDETLWSKSQTSLIRVAGLGLTGLFVAQIGAVVVGLSHALAAPHGLHARAAAIGGLLLGLSFLVMIWALSTRSQVRPLKLGDQVSLIFGSTNSDLLPPEKRDQPDLEAEWEDPAPGARLTTPEMWDTHGVLHRLRRVHLAFGFLVAALVVEAGVVQPASSWRIWLISALLALNVLSALVMTAGPHTSSGSLNLALIKVATGLAAGVWLGVVWPLLELPVVAIPVGVIAALGLWVFLTEMSDQFVSRMRRFALALVAFTVSSFGLAVTGSTSAMPTTSSWPNIHRVVLVQATLTGAALLAYYSIGVLRRPSPERTPGDRLWRPLVPIGALALALFIGASLGIALAVSAEYAATNLLADASPFANTSMIDHGDLDPTQRSILVGNGIDMGSYEELQAALGSETPNSDRLCAAGTCISPDVRWSVSRFDISKTDVVSNGGDWVAVAMLGFVSGIVAVCGVMMSLGGKAQRQGAILTVLRRVTRRADVLFASIGAVGVVFAGIQIWDLSLGDPAWDPAALSSGLADSALSAVVGVLATTAVVTGSFGLSRANRALAGLVLVVGATLVYLV